MECNRSDGIDIPMFLVCVRDDRLFVCVRSVNVLLLPFHLIGDEKFIRILGDRLLNLKFSNEVVTKKASVGGNAVSFNVMDDGQRLVFYSYGFPRIKKGLYCNGDGNTKDQLSYEMPNGLFLTWLVAYHEN